MSTASIANDIFGTKLYQGRARSALPILVRQAHANNPITYSSLARELSMPNPRNLNYVLGSIGVTLESLSDKLMLEIPPIQALVINMNTGLPGEGISPFFKDGIQYRKLSRKQKISLQRAMLSKIFTFAHWNLILVECGLMLSELDLHDILADLAVASTGGEGESHLRLKTYIAENPGIVALPHVCAPGDIEHSLLSGDYVDVHFLYEGQRIGIEVKSEVSDVRDIARGIFQCIKYQAVMEAELVSHDKLPDVRTLLVLEGEMPVILLPLCHSLGIEYLDHVSIV